MRQLGSDDRLTIPRVRAYYTAISRRIITPSRWHNCRPSRIAGDAHSGKHEANHGNRVIEGLILPRTLKQPQLRQDHVQKDSGHSSQLYIEQCHVKYQDDEYHVKWAITHKGSTVVSG